MENTQSGAFSHPVLNLVEQVKKQEFVFVLIQRLSMVESLVLDLLLMFRNVAQILVQ